MLQFINFSNYDSQVYLVMDEDAYYRWDVSNDGSSVRNWLNDRQTYKFELEFEGPIVRIVVYNGDERLLREDIKEVTYL